MLYIYVTIKLLKPDLNMYAQWSSKVCTPTVAVKKKKYTFVLKCIY